MCLGFVLFNPLCLGFVKFFLTKFMCLADLFVSVVSPVHQPGTPAKSVQSNSVSGVFCNHAAELAAIFTESATDNWSALIQRDYTERPWHAGAI